MAISKIKTNNYVYIGEVTLNENVSVGIIKLYRNGNSVNAVIASLKLASVLHANSQVDIGTLPVACIPMNKIWIPCNMMANGEDYPPIYLIIDRYGKIQVSNPVNAADTIAYINGQFQWLVD